MCFDPAGGTGACRVLPKSCTLVSFSLPLDLLGCIHVSLACRIVCHSPSTLGRRSSFWAALSPRGVASDSPVTSQDASFAYCSDGEMGDFHVESGLLNAPTVR